MSEQPSQLVFEDVTEQWELQHSFLHLSSKRIFICDSQCVFLDNDKKIVLTAFVRSDSAIVDWHNTLIAARKPSKTPEPKPQPKPPEPKYVPFENAEEARAVVGWEPWVKRKEESDVRRKIDFWNKTGACSYIWEELSESLLWSNTPDDDDSWKPFGKLVTE